MTRTLGPISYEVRELPVAFFGPRFYIQASREVSSDKGTSTFGWHEGGYFHTRERAQWVVDNSIGSIL